MDLAGDRILWRATYGPLTAQRGQGEANEEEIQFADSSGPRKQIFHTMLRFGCFRRTADESHD